MSLDVSFMIDLVIVSFIDRSFLRFFVRCWRIVVKFIRIWKVEKG